MNVALGVPELSFGLEQVRPKWLIAVGAVALLAAGQPISQSKTFAGTSLQTPVLKQNANLKVICPPYWQWPPYRLSLQLWRGVMQDVP